VIHALRDVIKHTPDLLSVRWKREGFISDSAARSKGKETPVNLLGFKDGTANPDSTDKALMDEVVWVTADQGEPAWAVGGSYQAARIIQFHVEFWDRTPLKEQQTIFGRDKHSGAPLCSTSTTCRITVKILTAIPLRWIAIFVWPIRARRRRSPA
jgi:deferrochelatase/peroxidase EfeB